MAQNTKRRRRFYKLLNGLALVVLGFLILNGVLRFFHIIDDHYTNAAQVEALVNPINARVRGYVKEVRYTEFQQVKKGDTLIILEDAEYQMQYQQALAAYQASVAHKNATSQSVASAQGVVGITDATISSAKAHLTNAEKNHKRYQDLFSEGAVSRQQYDKIVTEYQVSQANYQQMLRQKNENYLQVSETASKLEVNQAEIDKAEAALNLAKLNLEYTVITAPYDAIVGKKTINVGQLVQIGQNLTTLVDLSHIWVTANYLEKQMGDITLGQKIQITVDALKGKEFEGEVTAIAGATGAKYAAIPIDNATGNFVKVQQRIPVRIEFTANNNPEDIQRLRSGMNVEVRFK